MRTTYFSLAALAAAIGLSIELPVSAADADRQQPFIAVLTSGAPPAEKAAACKRLALLGDKAAVPALAPLLAAPELASWARIALEAIPDAEAAAALRAALGTLKGNLLVGAINSLGVRSRMPTRMPPRPPPSRWAESAARQPSRFFRRASPVPPRR